MQLAQCLAGSTRRNLLVIAKQRNVKFDYHWPKARLVNRLCTELAKTTNVHQALASLSKSEIAVLRRFIATGGQMAQDAFTKRFGRIRPYRPWREGERKPWLNPISPAERLFYLGLIFKVTIEEKPQELILIPDDVLPLLPKTPSPTLLETSPEPPAIEEQDIIRDVFAFLSFLNRELVRPIWGRWLTLNQMRRLNPYLMVKEDLRKVRSERQTGGRILFIHYLCERAGLMALTGPYLKPTPRVYEWLELGPTVKTRTLWDAWREESESNRKLWARYQLIGWKREDPLAALNRLLTHLSQCPPQQWFRLDSLPQVLEEIDDQFPPSEEQREQFEVDIVTRYLHWLGMVALGYGDEGEAKSFQLTPLGGLLLGQHREEEPAEVKKEPFTVTPDLEVVVPYGADLSLLFRLEEWAVLQAQGQERIYRLTRESVGRGLERGRKVEEMLSLLERASGDALPLEVVERLHGWKEEYGSVRIRQVIFLEAAERRILGELFADRGIRRHLGETISPRAALVRGEVRSLVEKLKKEGYLPQVDIVEAPAGERRREPSPGELIYLIIAATVYQELVHLLDLPVRIPHSVIEAMEKRVDREELEVARQAIQMAVARFKRTLGERAGAETPVLPSIPSFPIEGLLSRLQEAIESQRPVRIEYYTAGRGEFTQRKIDPYRIEWRDDIPYLVAYCHLRQGERVFRLNRIKSLELLEDFGGE